MPLPDGTKEEEVLPYMSVADVSRGNFPLDKTTLFVRMELLLCVLFFFILYFFSAHGRFSFFPECVRRRIHRLPSASRSDKNLRGEKRDL